MSHEDAAVQLQRQSKIRDVGASESATLLHSATKTSPEAKRSPRTKRHDSSPVDLVANYLRKVSLATSASVDRIQKDPTCAGTSREGTDASVNQNGSTQNGLVENSSSITAFPTKILNGVAVPCTRSPASRQEGSSTDLETKDFPIVASKQSNAIAMTTKVGTQQNDSLKFAKERGKFELALSIRMSDSSKRLLPSRHLENRPVRPILAQKSDEMRKPSVVKHASSPSPMSLVPETCLSVDAKSINTPSADVLVNLVSSPRSPSAKDRKPECETQPAASKLAVESSASTTSNLTAKADSSMTMQTSHMNSTLSNTVRPSPEQKHDGAFDTNRFDMIPGPPKGVSTPFVGSKAAPTPETPVFPPVDEVENQGSSCNFDEIERIISLPVSLNQIGFVESRIQLLHDQRPLASSQDETPLRRSESSQRNDIGVDTEHAKDLYALLNVFDEVSDAESHSFLEVLEYVVPLVLSSREFTASATSEILSLGVERGIMPHTIERLLRETEVLKDQSTQSRRELYDSNPNSLVLDLISSLSPRDSSGNDPLSESMDAMDDSSQDYQTNGVATFNESYAISDDAIEVHVDVTNIDGAQNEEEPWWKVASKLHGYQIQPPIPEMTPEQLLLKIKKDQPTEQTQLASTIEDDINGFWKQQKKAKQQSLPARTTLNERRNSISVNSTARRSKTSGISAVASMSSLARKQKKTRKSCFQKLWQESHTERTKNHNGFAYVDKWSLNQATRVRTDAHRLDMDPWESRSVKQRFLYEQSLPTRNWFGSLKQKAGNVVVAQPVCRPKSMEMPMAADSWTEEWVKPPRTATLEALGPEYAIYMGEESDSEGSWEETPECGKLKNVYLRPGELVSRLSPDYTSSLRQSRWRRKYTRR